MLRLHDLTHALAAHHRSRPHLLPDRLVPVLVKIAGGGAADVRGRRGRVMTHCRRNKANRPRGLCWTCYYTPGVRALYPVGSANPATAKYAPRGRSGESDPETMEELEALIAEQRKNLPDWWEEENQRLLHDERYGATQAGEYRRPPRRG